MEAVITQAPTEKNVSTVIDSWNNLVFLVREPDRHGDLVWIVRLVLGDLPPWKFGPFDSKKDARAAMTRLTEVFENSIGDIPFNISFEFRCSANQEL
jgi:hypothetical protein